MANTVAITKLGLGNHRTALHLYILGDGSPDLVDFVIFDPVVDLDLPPSNRFAIEEITYTFAGFTARVEFDYLTGDNMLWVLTENGDNYVDFTPWGGLKDRAAQDGNGKIKITTTGLSDGDQGSVIMTVRHQ